MFQIEPEDAKRLEDLNSSYRLIHAAGAAQLVHCHIIDLASNKVWARADGPDEPTAVRNAVEACAGAQKPMTAAETAVAYQELLEEVKQLKGSEVPTNLGAERMEHRRLRKKKKQEPAAAG